MEYTVEARAQWPRLRQSDYYGEVRHDGALLDSCHEVWSMERGYHQGMHKTEQAALTCATRKARKLAKVAPEVEA